MARPYRRNEILSNPFYLTLVAVSTIFVVTALAYVVSGVAVDPADARSVRVAEWFDRKGPLLLGVEFLVMAAVGVVMIAADRWSAENRKSGERGEN